MLMKKTVLFFFIHLFSVVCSAQSIGAFVYKGLAQSQTGKDVLRILDTEGFFSNSDVAYLKDEKNRIYEVTFVCGNDGVLEKTEIKDIPKERAWGVLYKSYLEYREKFQTYYGVPFDEFSQFGDGMSPKSDKVKMDLLMQGNCYYNSSFQVRSGWIAHLSISFNESAGAHISVTYLSDKSSLKSAEKGMMFMKVPMKKSLGEFVKELRMKGFVLNEIGAGSATLEGRFAGYNHCKLFVLESEVSKNIRSVIVSFQHQKDWDGIMSVYDNLKSMLKEKYGMPTMEKGMYGQDNTPENSQMELRKIIDGQSKYSLSFKLSNGFIVLSVTSALNVVLGYTDMANWNESRNDAIDDL